MRSFVKRFNHQEYNTLLSLQKYQNVPTLFGRDKTHMYMERYEMDLFDAIVSRNREHDRSVIDAEFCSSFFGFVDRLHRVEKIYHGDIKPENICLRDHEWALIDWESARPHGVESDVRTPDYSGAHRGAQGDIYAATMSVLVALTGRDPDGLHRDVHRLTDGVFRSAHMCEKDWKEIVRSEVIKHHGDQKYDRERKNSRDEKNRDDGR